jgi:hypothetical protein
MKIFISWSGARSRAIAEALNDWLRRVIQAVKPFYSPEIEKGAKWSNEVDAALEGTRFGIICLTPDNLESRWIHYEAGALSKTPDAIIWTFLHGIKPGDVPQPLGKFMATEARKDDMLKMLGAINKRLAEVGGEPVDSTVLGENFEVYWPKLEEKLKAVESGNEQDVTAPPLSEREVLSEILETVRGQQRISNVVMMRLDKVISDSLDKSQILQRSEPEITLDQVRLEAEIKDFRMRRIKWLMQDGVESLLAEHLVNNPDQMVNVAQMLYEQRQKEHEMLKTADTIVDPLIRKAMTEKLTGKSVAELMSGSNPGDVLSDYESIVEDEKDIPEEFK